MSASMDAAIGTELAGYRLESLLGRGGMGVVYRARDLALDRDVALKLLAPHLADDVTFRERFLTESRVAASLEHPNVVPIQRQSASASLSFSAASGGLGVARLLDKVLEPVEIELPGGELDHIAGRDRGEQLGAGAERLAEARNACLEPPRRATPRPPPATAPRSAGSTRRPGSRAAGGGRGGRAASCPPRSSGRSPSSTSSGPRIRNSICPPRPVSAGCQ